MMHQGRIGHMKMPPLKCLRVGNTVKFSRAAGTTAYFSER